MGSHRSSKARLFVALDLPDDARAALVAWREEAFAGRKDLRLVQPQALHVTLVFLGYVQETEVPRIRDLVRAMLLAGEAPVLRATGVRELPPRRPRLFALDLEDAGGRAAAVQSAHSEALEKAGLYEPEKRPFWPHVTLARVRRGERAGPLTAPPPPAEPWRAEAVTLYRSRLSAQGARYEPLERSPLPA